MTQKYSGLFQLYLKCFKGRITGMFKVRKMHACSTKICYLDVTPHKIHRLPHFLQHNILHNCHCSFLLQYCLKFPLVHKKVSVDGINGIYIIVSASLYSLICSGVKI